MRSVMMVVGPRRSLISFFDILLLMAAIVSLKLFGLPLIICVRNPFWPGFRDPSLAGTICASGFWSTLVSDADEDEDDAAVETPEATSATFALAAATCSAGVASSAASDTASAIGVGTASVECKTHTHTHNAPIARRTIALCDYPHV